VNKQIQPAAWDEIVVLSSEIVQLEYVHDSVVLTPESVQLEDIQVHHVTYSPIVLKPDIVQPVVQDKFSLLFKNAVTVQLDVQDEIVLKPDNVRPDVQDKPSLLFKNPEIDIPDKYSALNHVLLYLIVVFRLLFIYLEILVKVTKVKLVIDQFTTLWKMVPFWLIFFILIYKHNNVIESNIQTIPMSSIPCKQVEYQCFNVINDISNSVESSSKLKPNTHGSILLIRSERAIRLLICSKRAIIRSIENMKGPEPKGPEPANLSSILSLENMKGPEPANVSSIRSIENMKGPEPTGPEPANLSSTRSIENMKGPEPTGPEPANVSSIRSIENIKGPEPANVSSIRSIENMKGPEPTGPEPTGPEPANLSSTRSIENMKGPEPANVSSIRSIENIKGPEPTGPEPANLSSIRSIENMKGTILANLSSIHSIENMKGQEPTNLSSIHSIENMKGPEPTNLSTIRSTEEFKSIPHTSFSTDSYKSIPDASCSTEKLKSILNASCSTNDPPVPTSPNILCLAAIHEISCFIKNQPFLNQDTLHSYEHTRNTKLQRIEILS